MADMIMNIGFVMMMVTVILAGIVALCNLQEREADGTVCNRDRDRLCGSDSSLYRWYFQIVLEKT